jgi:hypothetical protein
VVRNWSSSPAFTWTPTATGTSYRVRAEARSAGATGNAAEDAMDVPFSITAAPAPTADSVSPSSGSGATQTFQLRYSNATGAAGLTTAWVWFNATFASTSANSCLAYYDSIQSRLFLINNAGTTWASAVLPSAGTLQNSQCSISLGGSSVATSGNTLTLSLAATFSGSFAGAKNVYLYAENAAGANSGWQTRGTFTVEGGTSAPPPSEPPPPPPPPAAGVAAVAATPSSGTGSVQTFALQYSDASGAASLSTAWVWFNATFASTSANSCLVYYDRPAHRLYLINDSGTAWASATLGSGGTLQNSRCAVSLGGSSAVANGTTLTLTLAATFADAFAGAKNIYMYAANAAGLNSGWQTRGQWTVPSGGATPPPSTPPPPPAASSVSAVSVSPSSGNGASRTFALQYADTAGAGSLSTAWVWFNATFASTSAGSCLVYVERSAGTVKLINDSGTSWVTGTAGGSGTLQNSQCSIALSGTSVAASGNTLTLNLPVAFATGFAGSKNIYMYAANSAGVNSGWQTRGTWTVPSGGTSNASVTAISSWPNSGSGGTQRFVLQYGSSNGAHHLSTAWVWFNASFAATSANSCLIYYDRPANMLFLINDAGTGWFPGIPGGGGVLQNSRCVVSLPGSSVSENGSTLTVTLDVTFAPVFRGTKNIYMYADNDAGANSRWRTRGSWVVP